MVLNLRLFRLTHGLIYANSADPYQMLHSAFGSLDAAFQQVPLVQNFWNIHNTVMEHQ